MPSEKEQLWRAVVDLTGGPDTARMLAEHHGKGRSLTQLARDRGINKSTAQRRMAAMRRKLASHGLLPDGWR